MTVEVSLPLTVGHGVVWENRILPRDISVGNVMLAVGSDSKETRAFITDLEAAKVYENTVSTGAAAPLVQSHVSAPFSGGAQRRGLTVSTTESNMLNFESYTFQSIRQ